MSLFRKLIAVNSGYLSRKKDSSTIDYAGTSVETNAMADRIYSLSTWIKPSVAVIVTMLIIGTPDDISLLAWVKYFFCYLAAYLITDFLLLYLLYRQLGLHKK